jgi:cytochrome P450
MEKIARCPYHSKLNAEFKPFDLTNPFPVYQKARNEEPVFYSEELGYWVVTRYADIKEVFGNWQVFLSENAQQPLKPILAKAKTVMEAAGMVGMSGLSGRIPPDHTRIRRVVSMAFGLSRIKKLEPRIRALAIDMIEKIRPNGQAEMIRELAYDLPAFVIFMLLGVPNEDVQKVKSWAESRLLLTWGDLSEDEQVIHAENMVRYWDYCQAMIAKRKTESSDDLPSDLVALQEEGHEITDKEIAGICYSMLFAGHETTTSLLGNGIRELLTFRHTWEAICDNKALIPNTVEEILRFSPSIVSWRRRSTQEAVVGGVTLPKGANILLVMGSANRDEAHFTDGETFDIGRKNAAQHLSMGSGIHFCIGAPLAKLEAKVVLEELTSRIPNLKLKPNQTYEFASNTSFRAPVALHVEW